MPLVIGAIPCVNGVHQELSALDSLSWLLHFGDSLMKICTGIYFYEGIKDGKGTLSCRPVLKGNSVNEGRKKKATSLASDTVLD